MVNIDHATERWHNHEYARPKSNWRAAWKNWMLQELTFQHARTTNGTPAPLSREEVRRQLHEKGRALAAALGEPYGDEDPTP